MGEAVIRAQAMVQEFMEKFGQPVNFKPQFCRPELRARLILEEAVETVVGMLGSYAALDAVAMAMRTIGKKPAAQPDMVETADGLCDLIYVALGAAVEFGIDLAPLWEEVHRSNMTKTPGVAREDGKILKGYGFEPPRIAELLRDQGWTGK